MSKKTLTINLFTNFISFFITMAINFFLTPYIIKNVGAEAYGFVSLGNEFVGYITLTTIALNSVAGRFVSIKVYNGDLHGANVYFSSVIFANLMIALLLAIPLSVFIIFIDKFIDVPILLLNDIQILFVFIFLGFLVSLMTSIFGVALFIKNKLYLTSMRGIEGTILRLVLLLFLFSTFSTKIFFIGLVGFIIQVYIILWNIYYTKKLTPELQIQRKYFKIEAIKELISAGSWNVVSQLSVILATGLDLLISNIFLGPITMATLAIAKIIPSILYQILYLIIGIFSPDMTKSYASGNFEKLKGTLDQSMKLVGMLINIPLAGFIVYGDIFYRLWVPSQDAHELHMLSILTVGVLILSSTSASIYSIFTITNKLKVNALVNFGVGILNIVIVIILLKKTYLGVYAVAGVSTVTGLIRVIAFTLPYGAKCLNQQWYVLFKTTFKTTYSFLVLSGTMLLLKLTFNIDSWLSLILIALFSAVIGLILNFFIIISQNERTQFLEIIKRKINYC